MAAPSQRRSIDILNRCLKLQAEDEKDVTRQQRLDELIADFMPCGKTEIECAAGWHFCVPASFRGALDVALTPRKVDGMTTMKWTQGSWFHFEEGDTIYDSVKAYQPWNLNNVKVCLKICKASPAQPAIRKRPRQPGTVIFNVLIPDAERKQLVNRQQLVLSQDEFVKLLIDGSGLPELA